VREWKLDLALRLVDVRDALDRGEIALALAEVDAGEALVALPPR
jgi:hypothetical protein